MKLLIVTQTVDKNDPILGFFVGWIREFGKQCTEVHVLALNVGTYELPENVTVHCLGKSEGKLKIVWLWRLWRLSFTLRHDYDNVFVHMNPTHIVFMGWWWSWILKKRIGLWYTHPKVDIKLRIAEALSNYIFTGSESSFRIKTKKKHVIGQGIDINSYTTRINHKVFENQPPKIIVIGRLSPIKNLELAIDTIARLQSISNNNPELTIIGGPMSNSDNDYVTSLKVLAKEKKVSHLIKWVGPIPSEDVPSSLTNANIFLHTSLTHSADKTLPEAMISGLFVVTSNKAYQGDVPTLSFQKPVPDCYAKSVNTFLSFTLEEKSRYVNGLQETVKIKHSLLGLVKKILNVYV